MRKGNYLTWGGAAVGGLTVVVLALVDGPIGKVIVGGLGGALVGFVAGPVIAVLCLISALFSGSLTHMPGQWGRVAKLGLVTFSFLGVVLGAYIGGVIGYHSGHHEGDTEHGWWVWGLRVAGTLAGALLGFLAGTVTTLLRR